MSETVQTGRMRAIFAAACITSAIIISLAAPAGAATSSPGPISGIPTAVGAGQVVTWVPEIHTSATGALAAGTGTITITAPAGTNLGYGCSSSNPDYFSGGSAAHVPLPCPSGNKMTIVTPVAIPAYGLVDVTLAGMRNTTVPGSDTLTISTSAGDTFSTSYQTYSAFQWAIMQFLHNLCVFITPIPVTGHCGY